MDPIARVLRIKRLNLPKKGSIQRFMDAALGEAARKGYAWGAGTLHEIDKGLGIMSRVHSTEDAAPVIDVGLSEGNGDCSLVSLD